MGHSLLLQRGRFVGLVLQLSLRPSYIRYVFFSWQPGPFLFLAHQRSKI